MNEVSNFCEGECDNFTYPWLIEETPKTIKIKEEKKKKFVQDIPCNPGNRSLADATMSMTALHYGGIEEIDVHSIYGFLQSKATNQFLKEKLGHYFPMIITRSNFYGNGRWASHWTGDNSANWDYLRVSIPTIYQFNLFGIPYVGADICGFNDNTTA